jgi:hypothetical protein
LPIRSGLGALLHIVVADYRPARLKVPSASSQHTRETTILLELAVRLVESIPADAFSRRLREKRGLSVCSPTGKVELHGRSSSRFG